MACMLTLLANGYVFLHPGACCEQFLEWERENLGFVSIAGTGVEELSFYLYHAVVSHVDDCFSS